MTTDRPAPRGRAAWIARHRLPLGLAAAAGAAALTVVWCFVVPEKSETAPTLQGLVIRWAHPLCWALLALAALRVAFSRGQRVRDALLWAAAACYAAFLAALVL